MRPPGAACLGVSPRPWAPEISGAAVKVASAHMQVEARGGEPSDFWAITVPGTSWNFGGTKSPRSHFGGPRGCRHRVGDPCGLRLGLGEAWEQIPALVFSPLPRDVICGGSPRTRRRAPERRAAPPACAPRVSNHCPARPRGPLGPLLGPWAFATCVLGMRSERLRSRARSRGRWGLRGRGQGLLQVSASTWTAPGKQVSMESGGLVPRGSQLQMHPHQGGDPEGGHCPGFRRFPGGRSPGGCPGPAPPGPARVRRPLSVQGQIWAG